MDAIITTDTNVNAITLLTATQITEACPTNLSDLGKRIAAHYGKLIQCEGKAEQHKATIGQLLKQAKEACDEDGFDAFRERFCPDLGRTRAYELLQIASGKKTGGEIRTNNAERNRRHRAKKKIAEPIRHVTDAEPKQVDAEPEPAPIKVSVGMVPTSAPPTPEVVSVVMVPRSEVKPDASKKALAEFKYACEYRLPKMNVEDRAEAIKYAASFAGAKR